MTNDDYEIDDAPFDPQSRFEQPFEPEFWKKKKLKDMTDTEWELLCDGCGKCCLNKLEIKGNIRFTNAHCRFFDCQTCLCKVYDYRLSVVPDCVDITLPVVKEKPRWLPKTCAYWLLDNGFDLPDWHPLITKKAASVHDAKMSLQGRNIISESEVKDYENHLIDWEDL